jgi:hypothetical protein
MEKVYLTLSMCCQSEGATKSEILSAMKFFKIPFNELDWKRVMRINKREHGLFYKNKRWFCYDYCIKSYVQQTLEKDGNYMGFSMSLPSFYSENRDNYRKYFSVLHFDF